MDWDAIRDNLGLIIFAAIWLLSFLMRSVRGRTDAAAPMGPLARRRRARRRAVIVGFVLMAVAVGLWEYSRGIGGQEEAVLRLVAGVLAVAAILAVFFAGFSRPERALQGDIDFERPDERAAEISAGEPFEPS